MFLKTGTQLDTMRHLEMYKEKGKNPDLYISGHPIVNDYLYNTAVWGPKKGKGGDFGKSHKQVTTRVHNVAYLRMNNISL